MWRGKACEFYLSSRKKKRIPFSHDSRYAKIVSNPNAIAPATFNLWSTNSKIKSHSLIFVIRPEDRIQHILILSTLHTSTTLLSLVSHF